jgi:hypothetical protein
LRNTVHLIGYVVTINRRIEGSNRSILTVGVPFAAKTKTDGTFDKGTKTGYFDVTIWEESPMAGTTQTQGQVLDYLEVGMDVSVDAVIQDMRYYENGKQTSKFNTFSAYSFTGLGYRLRPENETQPGTTRSVRREPEALNTEAQDEGFREVEVPVEPSQSLYEEESLAESVF